MERNDFIIILQIISIVLSLATLSFLLICGKKNNILRFFILYQSSTIAFSAVYTLELLFCEDIASKWIFLRFQYVIICFICWSWMLFCLVYTGRIAVIKIRHLIVSGVVTVGCLLVIFTNDLHHLFFRSINPNNLERGPIFWVVFGLMTVWLFVGMMMLMVNSLNLFEYGKKQRMLLALAIIIPIFVGTLTISPIVPPGIDLTPSSFTISNFIIVIAIFRYGFMNILPAAMREIVASMKEAVLVVDVFDNIIDFNNSFENLFGKYVQIAREEKVYSFVSRLRNYTIDTAHRDKLLNAITYGVDKYIFGELEFVEPLNWCFSVYINPVSNKRGQVVGRIVSLSDISSYKQLLVNLEEKNHKINDLNEELIAQNEQLKILAKTSKDLAISEERNRFARDVHDTLGHTMVLLISLLEVCRATCESQPDKTKEKLDEAIKISKGGLSELRCSISGLVSKKLEAENLINSIKSLIFNFSSSNIDIDFSVDGIDNYSNPVFSEVIYRLCQEALTNALRHGKAKNVSIILRFENKSIKLFIFDDGCGCKEIKKGIGLLGMEQRVASLNGTIIYGSNGEHGFNINVEIPLEVDS